jgi:2-keto-3-deoxy-galactonokinase
MLTLHGWSGLGLGAARMFLILNWDAQKSSDASPQQGEESDVVGTESNQGYGHSIVIVQGSHCVWAKLL